MISVSSDHPLVGTWITSEEDSNAAFIFEVSNNQFRVSGFCRTDGEQFQMSDVNWDGQALSFVALMPSTNTVSRNIFRMRPDGTADLALTTYEIWKKRDVSTGEPPATW